MAESASILKLVPKVSPAECDDCRLFRPYARGIVEGEDGKRYQVRVIAHFCPSCGRRLED